MNYGFLSEFLEVEIMSGEITEVGCEHQFLESDFAVAVSKSDLNRLSDKLLFWFFKKLFFKKVVKKLEKEGLKVGRIIGVYPDFDRPLALFDLDEGAESYINDNFIPKSEIGIKGLVKQILFIINGYHPTIDSYVFLVGKRNRFELVSELVKDLGGASVNDFICITTSNPVFLSFTDNQNPDVVIHKGTSHEFEVKKSLSKVIGNLMAEPLQRITKGGENYIVEKGLPGKPWFQLKKNKLLSDKVV